MSEGRRRPTHTLVVKSEASVWTEAGVAWLNDNGFLSIQLNPGVTLSWDDGLRIGLTTRTSEAQVAQGRPRSAAEERADRAIAAARGSRWPRRKSPPQTTEPQDPPIAPRDLVFDNDE